MRLTVGQVSALECAGLAEGAAMGDAGDALLLAALDGRRLRFEPAQADAIAGALTWASNAEDAAAESTGDTGARGAALALANLAGKVLRAGA